VNADTAAQLLADHRPDAVRACVGCYEQWGRLTWWPCPQAEWAQRVLAEAGIPAPQRPHGTPGNS
jgi:hypothetical protein